MNTMALNISEESNVLLEPNLHDGRLVGINLLSEGNLELNVSEVRGKKHRILLDGVVQFHATDFREGNIILDVTIIRGDDVKMVDLASLQFVGQNTQRAEEYLKKLHERVLRESLYVLELNPSYGCQLIGVAKNIRLESIEST